MEEESRGPVVVVPGEVIGTGDNRAGENTVKVQGSIVATRVGIRRGGPEGVSVIPLKGFYVPRVGDLVVGIVCDVSYNMWKVDINSPYFGILPATDVFGRRFDPTMDDPLKEFDIGTVLKVKIVAFDRSQDPLLTVRDQDLGKADFGFLARVNPSKIARVIGRGGSMLSKIQQASNSKVIVGQNGTVILTTSDPAMRDKLIRALKLIEEEAHVYGLTEKVVELISGKVEGQ